MTENHELESGDIPSGASRRFNELVEGEAGPAPSPAAPKPGRSLLALSDAPDLETGFARVARNLYRGWLSAGVFDRIQVFGIGYEGFPYDLPGIVQIPAATMLDPRWFSPFNLRRFATQAKAYRDELAGRGEELSLFVVQDPAHLCDLAEAFLAVGFEPAREGVKFLAYAPADADQPAEIKRRLSAAVGRVYSEVIAYCETGRRWLGLPDGARAVPHGVDRTAFCPDAVEDGLRKDEIPGWRRCRRLDRRKGYLGNLAEEPARLLVSVCRPDPRKGIFHSLLVLKELLKLGSYRLYLHMPAVDPVVRWAAALELPPKSVVLGGGFFSAAGRSLLGEDGLRDIYLSADLLLSTAHGEGWGMPITEALACGVPVAAPAWGPTGEILAAADVDPQLVVPLRAANYPYAELGDGGVVRRAVDPHSAAAEIHAFLESGRRTGEPAGLRGVEAMLGWDEVAQRFWQ